MPTYRPVETIDTEPGVVPELPSDLHRQVAAALRRQPEIPWDLAVADIARKALHQEGSS